jgi:acetyltransferase-like isoleucine patch superfamily enzyme
VSPVGAPGPRPDGILSVGRKRADVTDTDGGSGSDGPSDEGRHGRVQRHPTPGGGNSLRYWTDAKPVWRVTLNYLLVWVARIAPSLRVRSWVLRRLGATVGEGVSWGLEATPDVFWPELITLGDDVIVGYDSVILCHEFLQDEYRTGEVIVGDRAMIGAKAVILPGVRIGADAQGAADSLVTRDVPAGATVAGVPAQEMSDGDSASADAGTGGPQSNDSGAGPDGSPSDDPDAADR